MQAISLAMRALDANPVPKSCDPERSTISRAVSSRSSTCCLMKRRPRRAVTFQSIARMSSPGWYSRTSENSSPRPLNTERYSPLKSDSTSPRVRSSICFTRAEKTRGCSRVRWIPVRPWPPSVATGSGPGRSTDDDAPTVDRSPASPRSRRRQPGQAERRPSIHHVPLITEKEPPQAPGGSLRRCRRRARPPRRWCAGGGAEPSAPSP